MSKLKYWYILEFAFQCVQHGFAVRTRIGCGVPLGNTRGNGHSLRTTIHKSLRSGHDFAAGTSTATDKSHHGARTKLRKRSGTLHCCVEISGSGAHVFCLATTDNTYFHGSFPKDTLTG